MTETNVPWFLSRKFVLIMLTIFGPLALILVWMSPRFTMRWKIVTSVVTVVLTLFFLFVLGAYLEDIRLRLEGAY